MCVDHEDKLLPSKKFLLKWYSKNSFNDLFWKKKQNQKLERAGQIMLNSILFCSIVIIAYGSRL